MSVVEHNESRAIGEDASLVPHDMAETAIRARIRSFLLHFFQELGEPLPSAWPHVSVREKGIRTSTIREQVSVLHAYIQTIPGWTPEQVAWLRVCGENVCQLLELDVAAESWLDQPSGHVPSDSYAMERSMPISASSMRLHHTILRAFDTPDRKVLWMGDAALACVHNETQPSCSYHTAGVEQAWIDTLDAQLDWKVTHHDVAPRQKRMPASMHQAFDAVVIAPPWEREDVWRMIDQAVYCLRDTLDARVYMVWNPMMLEDTQGGMSKLLSFVPSLGMTFDQIEEGHWLCDWQKSSSSEEISHDEPTPSSVWHALMPTLASPLYTLMTQAPYACASLYTLRRLPFERRGAFYQRWHYLRHRMGW